MPDEAGPDDPESFQDEPDDSAAPLDPRIANTWQMRNLREGLEPHARVLAEYEKKHPRCSVCGCFDDGATRGWALRLGPDDRLYAFCPDCDAAAEDWEPG